MAKACRRMPARPNSGLHNRGAFSGTTSAVGSYSDCDAFMFGGGSPGRDADPGAALPVAGEGVPLFVGAASAPPVSAFPLPLLPVWRNLRQYRWKGLVLPDPLVLLPRHRLRCLPFRHPYWNPMLSLGSMQAARKRTTH